ncbi:MAG: sugar transporter ATP-binding protein [Thermoleophilia bacterium]|nr:sugar transporter ATP-binding protein [Thermoleophilia bacterium]MCZ4496928.1 sugar transporter ATP-binding protein [Thermoleophilia bacterium]
MTAATGGTSGANGAGAQPILELRGVSKRFGDFYANRDVNFDLRPGEVHCLCGENGAGKSTMMNMLYGLLEPSEGTISMDGREVHIGGPRHAIDLGIGMVHQHFMLIPVFTVAENIVLADEPTQGATLDIKAAEQRVRELSDRYGLSVDPTARVQDITVGQQQRAEILKALYRKARILILDEPTAVLTPQEIEELLSVIRQLRDEGMSIIMITHKLKEVLSIADRVTVLRRGLVIDTVPCAGQTEASLANLMVGRDVLLKVDKSESIPERPVLQVRDLWVKDDRLLDAVRGASLEVHAGEIVALAGIDGNGQAELVDAIAGLRKSEGGEVVLDGEVITGLSVHEISDAGLGHIPADRLRRGLVLDFDLRENTLLHDWDKPDMVQHGIIDRAASAERTDMLCEMYDVRSGGGITSRSGSLSGGNQQKLVIAREIQRDPKLLIAAQPTRGVDIGAIEFIHKRLVEERDAGTAVLLVSLEMQEVLSLADRIIVIFEGQIVAEFEGGRVDEQGLGMAMIGSGDQNPGEHGVGGMPSGPEVEVQ